MQTYALISVIAYLLGSIPFGYLLVRLFRGEDVRQTGSGNIGATNVARKAPGLGIATLILDAAKGYAAVAIAVAVIHGTFRQTGVTAATWEQVQASLQLAQARVQHTYIVAAIAAICAILGHMFPLWLKFKGGKGVATGVGAFLALAPWAVAVVLVIFLAVVIVSRYVSLGSIIATAAFPVLAWALYRYQSSPGVLAIMAAASLLIIYKHKDNIRRLLAGTEHRFELKRGAKA